MGILSGYRVLDCSIAMAGPFAAQRMGDLGADVVKVEPTAGEWQRFRSAGGANGNRINKTANTAVDTTTYSTISNQLVGTTGADPQTYGYDALGNITTLNGTTAYQYDAFNRMSAAGGMSYYVNPEGQRLRKSGSLGTTYFAPDQGGTLLAENDSGAWIDYVWLGGRLIGHDMARACVTAFLGSDFAGGRHQRRVDQLSQLLQDSD